MTTKTVLLGKGEVAIRAAGWLHRSPDHDLVAVVPVVPEPSWTGSLATWCSDHEIPTVTTGDYRDLWQLGVGPIDLAISVFYDRIIRQDFIDRCDRIINLHNSPLPRYRGVSPINWALKNAETEHGVTVHEITAGVDDGPIYSQVRFSIYPEQDEVQDVLARATDFGWSLLKTTLPIIDRIEPVPQQHDLATHYRRRDDERLDERRGFTRRDAAVPAGSS